MSFLFSSPKPPKPPPPPPPPPREDDKEVQAAAAREAAEIKRRKGVGATILSATPGQPGGLGAGYGGKSVLGG